MKKYLLTIFVILSCFYNNAYSESHGFAQPPYRNDVFITETELDKKSVKNNDVATDTTKADQIVNQLKQAIKGYPEVDYMGYYRVPDAGRESTGSKIIHSITHTDNAKERDILSSNEDGMSILIVGLSFALGTMLWFMIPILMVWNINKSARINITLISIITSILGSFVPNIFGQITGIIFILLLIYAFYVRKQWRNQNVKKNASRKRNR